MQEIKIRPAELKPTTAFHTISLNHALATVHQHTKHQSSLKRLATARLAFSPLSHGNGHAPKTRHMQDQALTRQQVPIARILRPTSAFFQHGLPERQNRKHCRHNCFLKPLVIEGKEPQPCQALTCPSLAPLFCSILEASCAHQLCQNPSSMCKQPGSWCKGSSRCCLSCCCLWAFVVETWPAYLSAGRASCALSEPHQSCPIQRPRCFAAQRTWQHLAKVRARNTDVERLMHSGSSMLR